MTPNDIRWMHVELSSKCNAWCPACARNNLGFGLVDFLVEQDLDLNRYEEVLQQLPDLYAVQLCGNYGDPIIAANVVEAIDISKKYVKKIQIHTNGSLRSTEWWSKLATQLSDIDHDVWFGIDGLEGVHEIYRQGTSYTKIINNAKAFIDAGGHATWQFIPYAHNEHQVKDCMRKSQELGFKHFKLAKFYRDETDVRNYRTGEPYKLSPPKKLQTIIRMPKTNTYVDPVNCMHMQQPSIYLAANGSLSQCCYLAKVKQFANFDNVENLLYNVVDLKHRQCLNSCGS